MVCASFESVFDGARVLVTGHTGFKGVWLASWLEMVGAKVHGIALAPDTEPNLFEATGLHKRLVHHEADIRHAREVADLVADIDPVFVFHLAAQPLVRRSFRQPLETFSTNTMGTANLLEACRNTKSTRVVVCVTTDKVYENNQLGGPYQETDRLGGADPYSSSKACAELIVDCYRQTMGGLGNGMAVATARGGNVLGGGDWSEDRLVPDFVRAVQKGTPLVIRNAESVRPWQHVLSLCHGYMLLAAAMYDDPARGDGHWNFGPSTTDSVTVGRLLKLLGDMWRQPEIVLQPDNRLKEAGVLLVDAGKAKRMLGWQGAWNLNETIKATAEWYRDFDLSPGRADELVRSQIIEYRAAVEGRAMFSKVSC